MKECWNLRQKGFIRNFRARALSAFLAMLVLALMPLSTEADGIQSRIDAAESRQANSRSQLKSVEATIASLQSKKQEVESYLTELDEQLGALREEIKDLNQRYEEKEGELDQTETELAASYRDKERQYNAMKKRIQFMYETSSDNGMLEAIFSAESFTDFVSRVTTMSDLTKYDREMLEQYEATCKEIEKKEAELKKQKEELEALSKEAQSRQEDLKTLYSRTEEDVARYASELEGKKNAQTALLNSIQSQQSEIASLLAKKSAEEESARRAAEEENARRQAQAAAAIHQQQAAAEETPQRTVHENASKPADAPVAQLATKKEEPAATTDSGSSQGKFLGHWVLTAYCPCAICCGVYAKNKGLTASGVYATPGTTVAMYGVPFGTKLSINGHIYTVQDRGTPYGHVDIYFATHAEALAFGRQTADVYQVN